MAIALEQFVKQLQDSGVIAPGKLKNFVPPKAHPKDVQELAKQLVQSKQLTKFQVQEVYLGRAKSLFLGNYTLLDKIGAGGMGQVFKAEHRRMKRLVAIKTLPKAVTKEAAAVARFEREVEAAAKLEHPNIVTAYDADQAGDAHFLVMQYVEGSDLAAIVKKSGPLGVPQAINYILQAARGLDYAHKHGVIHRDIKPANLLLSSEGTVKILDMGLARLSGPGDAATQAELTGTGSIMGTVDYMAPEQALSTKHADARADIYSLGCTLYYLLTGQAVYDGETLMAKMLAHREAPIPNLLQARPEASPALAAVFRKMVAKRVEDRYQSMGEVIAALEQASAGEQPAPGLPPPIAESGAGVRTFLQQAAAKTTHLPGPTRTATAPSAAARNRKLMIGAGAVALVGAVLLVGRLLTGGGDGAPQTSLDPAKPSVATVPAPSSTPAKDAAAPIDLLKLIDVKRDAVEGRWITERSGALQSPKAAGSFLQIPFTPQHNYQLTIVARRVSANMGALMFGITVNGQRVSAAFDAFGSTGLGLVDGRTISEGAPHKEGLVFTGMELHTLVVTVRGSAVELAANGQTLVKYPGGAALSLPPQYPAAKLNPNQLVVSTWTAYRITRLELLPLGDVGPQPAPALSEADAARRAAAWAIDHRGILELTVGPKTIQVRKVADLPSGPFALKELLFPVLRGDEVQLGFLSDPGFRDLEVFQVRAVPITDAALENFQRLRRLKVVRLASVRITDAGMATLAKLPALAELGVRDCDITDAGLIPLKGTLLVRLHLNNTAITDAGLAHLEKLTTLTDLILTHTKITDEGLTHLAKLPKLQALSLRETKVTAAGVAALKKALPSCVIQWDDPSHPAGEKPADDDPGAEPTKTGS